MSERLPFECKVGGYELSLTMGQCAVALFRTKQEVTYITAEVEEDGEAQELRVFNNPELAEYMAGYKIVHTESGLERPTTLMKGLTFREVYGWNPPVVEKEEPYEWEEEMWVELNTRDLEEGFHG